MAHLLLWFYFDGGIIYQLNIFSIDTKAEGEINNDAIHTALVGYAGCRGDFKLGRKVIPNCLYLMISEKQFCTLVCASERRAVLAYVYLANVWGPFRIAASICSVDHYGLQLTGQTLVSFDCRRGLTRWSFEYVRGHIRLSLTIFL